MKSQRKKAARQRRSAAGNRDGDFEALAAVLSERIKELTLLHRTTRLLQTSRPLTQGLLDEILAGVPEAWQHAEACAARLAYGDWEATTRNWRDSRWKQSEDFSTSDGATGVIEVVYLEERPDADEGPFLLEERELIKSLADMLGAFLERTRAETHARRLTRTYEMLSGINSAMVRIHDRDRLYREACRIAVEHGQFGVAWIGTLDPGSNMVTPVTWSGPNVDAALLDRLAGSVRVDTAKSMGPVARAVRERRPVYCNDISTEPTIVDREALLHLGLRGFITLPLLVNGAVTGVLGMHSQETEFFDVEEVKLLDELAADLSFALEYIGKEEEVRDLAYHEPLTRLPNRISMQRRLATAVDDAASKNHVVALMLLNLDNFRDINNSLGHQNGDRLLRHVAQTLRAALWESDWIAALGGDEFAVLLPRLAEKTDIDLVLGKIKSALHKPLVLADVPVNIEFTLGVALYPDHGDAADLIWQHADVALRTAKERHETLLFYDTAFDHYDPDRLALIGELRDAIRDGTLGLHFQPIIDVRTGRATAIEALARWEHPERGRVFPDEFIPLAEQTGLINPLTVSIAEKALRLGAELQRAQHPLTLSINISARNLQDADLAGKILALAEASGFPRERLVLEITESAIMAEPVRARRVLNTLHHSGIQISMDDFGIGQSSLSYLKDLPISRIKIDKSFLIAYWQPRNAAIVRSAIDLARNLELVVTAEGVEDEATYLELRKSGCDFAQGYYFSRPLAPDRLSEWLRDSEWK